MIPIARPYIAGNELKYARECIKTKWISSLGRFVAKFEEGFAGYCGCRYGISACNGTAALHLALVTLGIGSNDEVIVPNLTFVATANTVYFTGAKPVFIDAEEATWNIDPLRIEDKITPRTKAIIAVHLFGHPAQMDMILRIARKHNLYVIEDACEAHGALYKEKKVGSIGYLGVFSFYGNKIITTGEGGMIITSNKKFSARARFLRDHAMSKKKRYYHSEPGFNYRMTNIQAAIGLAQLEKIDYIIKKKIEIAKAYNSLLKGFAGITLPPEEKWARNVYWMYSILINNGSGNLLTGKLAKRGIDTRPFFTCMHKLPHYQRRGSFPVSDRLSREGINLPCFIGIKKKEIGYVCDNIKDILSGGRKR